MENDVFLLCGPYLGDFKQEILTFRPHIQWISDVTKHQKSFVCSHYNRKFLYSNHDNFFEIKKELSWDEENQKNYFHNQINKKEYNKILKTFKEQITINEKMTKKQCKIFNLSYVQFLQPYSIYQKTFHKIEIPDVDLNEVDENTIVLIPDLDDPYRISEFLYNNLSKKYKICIIGDKKTYLQEENIILNKIDYLDNVYKYILKYISVAKVVLTPSSHWTFLCNLQNSPVFSWGESFGLFKEGGDLNFNNKNSFMYVDEETNKEKILNQVKWFINGL